MARFRSERLIGTVSSTLAREFHSLSATMSFLLIFWVAGCQRMMPLDTKPLDNAGMNYNAIKHLQALDITSTEVTELVKARTAGFPDEGCVEIVRIYHGRERPFSAGAMVAGLVQVRLREDTILELARLDQLGVNGGELQLIRLAGFSDAMVLEVARHEAAGKPALSGAALSNMKNSGMRESLLLELVRRSVPDSQTAAIIGLHRHGVSDADILRRYPSA